MTNQNLPLILVTGANGQLGSELKLLAAEAPYQFLFTDIDELNLVDSQLVHAYFEKHKIDFCINCAAYTAVDKAEEDIKTARLINADAVKNLAEACLQHNALFLHISTDFVFDGTSSVPLRESDLPNPVNAYGITKLEGEKLALANCPTTIIIRTSWLYSSFGNNFVKTMLRLAETRSELIVIFDQVGTPTYARDLARTLICIIDQCGERNVKDLYGIYHYSNEGVASWYDFAQAIFSEVGRDILVKPVLTSGYPTPAIRPHFLVMDKGKIKDTFNLSIPHWRTSLKDCLAKLAE